MKLRGIHSYETRFSTSDCLNVPHYRLSSCQCSFLFNAVHLWNDIPATIGKVLQSMHLKLDSEKGITVLVVLNWYDVFTDLHDVKLNL